MLKFEKPVSTALQGFSPISRLYQSVKKRQRRNHNLNEFRHLSIELQEDIGLFN